MLPPKSRVTGVEGVGAEFEGMFQQFRTQPGFTYLILYKNRNHTAAAGMARAFDLRIVM